MRSIDIRAKALMLGILLVCSVVGLVSYIPEYSSGISVTGIEPDANGDSVVSKQFELGVTQLRYGQYRQAIDSFRGVMLHSPNMPEAYLNIGFAQYELQQPELAFEAFQTAIDLRPTQVNAYWGLAVSLEAMCDIPGAIGAMRTYLHLAKSDSPYMMKAKAALWEWEQLKAEAEQSNAGMFDCS